MCRGGAPGVTKSQRRRWVGRWVDRADVERLLRYCARPPLAQEHLQQLDAGHLVYHCSKPGPDGPSALGLTLLALINRIAAPLPPPRIHRHRY